MHNQNDKRTAAVRRAAVFRVRPGGDGMPLFDFREFLRLSSVLNYNLSAASLNRYNVLQFIIEDKKLSSDPGSDREQKGIVMEALNYLFTAYSDKRRRLGPMAVLHPLRAAALFTRSRKKIDLLTLLTVLFHDILEDINSRDYETQRWRAMENQLYDILQRLPLQDETALIARLTALSRRPQETYYEYIGRLLESTEPVAVLVQTKLADRLDNTLDMRIDLQDPLGEIDFFQVIFEVLFVNNYPGYRPRPERPPTAVLNGARRLFQLFKNAVLLSLIRQMADIRNSRPARQLFVALADASLQEAQRTLLHLLGRRYQNVANQRALLVEAMEYCYAGRTDLVTEPDRRWMLDGLFSSYFGHGDARVRDQQLDRLYQDKPLMIEASVAFIVIFCSFLNNRHYYVKGISASGISPKMQPPPRKPH
jgi:hypothetical protein